MIEKESAGEPLGVARDAVLIMGDCDDRMTVQRAGQGIVPGKVVVFLPGG